MHNCCASGKKTCAVRHISVARSPSASRIWMGCGGSSAASSLDEARSPVPVLNPKRYNGVGAPGERQPGARLRGCGARELATRLSRSPGSRAASHMSSNGILWFTHTRADSRLAPIRYRTRSRRDTRIRRCRRPARDIRYGTYHLTSILIRLRTGTGSGTRCRITVHGPALVAPCGLLCE